MSTPKILPETITALLLILSAHLSAQQPPDPLCTQAAKVQMPAAGLRRVPPAKDCDPLKLYYQGTSSDLREARDCAFAQLGPQIIDNSADAANQQDQGDESVESLMANAVLAMIYAQGKGVPPDLGLAERFACDMHDWGSDGRDIARQFEQRRKEGAATAPFDICKTPLERQSNYACISLNQTRVAEERREAEKHFNTGSPSQRAAFARLLAARKIYSDARAAEDPNGNTGLVQAAMQIENDLDRAWARMLSHFAAGDLPHANAQDYAKADAALNAAYQVALTSTAACTDDICLTTAQLRAAERAWMTYRDTWLGYARIRWPTVSSDAFRTVLTLERTDDLKNIGN